MKIRLCSRLNCQLTARILAFGFLCVLAMVSWQTVGAQVRPPHPPINTQNPLQIALLHWYDGNNSAIQPANLYDNGGLAFDGAKRMVYKPDKRTIATWL